MTPKEKLKQLYSNSKNISDIEISADLSSHIETIKENLFQRPSKGVFTVLITLAVYKSLHPEQDVRIHQSSMTGGFSGRSFDTSHITPTLMQLIPSISMRESGWLTRSLEQPHPYNLDYPGKITPTKIKNAFLQILNQLENNPNSSNDISRLLLHYAILAHEHNQLTITPLDNPENLMITELVAMLTSLFEYRYSASGQSKLPVIAFQAIYSILLTELSRFDNCRLSELASHTSPDSNSGAVGDIEIFCEGDLFEAIEVKSDIEIDLHIVNRVLSKIKTTTVKRYYILSTVGIKESEKVEIEDAILKLRIEHGCQLIINGIIPTLKYYLRLLDTPEQFVEVFSELLSKDLEIQREHKEQWQELLDGISEMDL